MSYLQACVCGWLVVVNWTYLHAQEPRSTAAGKLQSRPLYQSLQASLDLLSQAEIACETATLLSKQDEEFAPIRDKCRAAIKQLRAIETPL
ncbi:MAG: hypothetical protein ACR2NM_14480, partial [Bythopirellula sp.]